MKRFDSWNDLFSHWENIADRYTALGKLREFYDRQKADLNEPFQKRMFEYAEKHGANSLTAKVRDELFAPSRESIRELERWHDQKIKEIVEYYERKDQG